MTHKLKYTNFDDNERELLFKYLVQGKTQTFIAEVLNRDPSTVSREIRRDGMTRKSYSPIKASLYAKRKALKRKKKIKLSSDSALTSHVLESLKKRWSPQLTSQMLKRDDTITDTVSHETIYQFIYHMKDLKTKKEIVSHLRRRRSKRKTHKRSTKERTTIRDYKSIHMRPAIAKTREEPGHWEGDLIIGKDHKSAIGTLVDRTTRQVIMVSFKHGYTTKDVVLGFAAAFALLPSHLKKSLTYDRGTEMCGHKKFTELTGIDVYFADPYSPWQRGTNENTNGLIRDYFPKKTDFREIDDRFIKQVELELNQRPRKCLDYSSPEEVFSWFLVNPGRDIHDFLQSQISLVV